MESELDLNNGIGITAWLVDGLKIQEDQYVSDSQIHGFELTCTGQFW